MAINLKEIFTGAAEAAKNYLSAGASNLGLTQEEIKRARIEALKKGPIGSAPYKKELERQYAKANVDKLLPMVVGAVGRAGAGKEVAKKATAKVIQATKAAPIKNLPAFVKSIVQKEVAAVSKSAPAAKVGGFLQTPFQKLIAVGGLITGTALAITNTLDFYNWNGPIQTALKSKFPWLFAARQNLDKGIKKPEIKRLSPNETRQLQQMIFEATGKMLTGEELRQAIQQAYGITVLEERPTKGNTAGPLGVGPAWVGFSGSVSSATKSNIKAQPKLMINTPEELQESTLNEVSAFIQGLPSRLSFDYTIKATYVDADGRRRKGNYAVVKVSIVNKKGTKTEVAELPLGTVPPNIGTPTPLDGNRVAAQVQETLKTSFITGAPAEIEPGFMAEVAPPPPPVMDPRDIEFLSRPARQIADATLPAGVSRTPIKYYDVDGFVVFAPWVGNTPYGHKEISLNEFIGRAKLQKSNNRAYASLYDEILRTNPEILQPGALSDYVIINNVPMRLSSLAEKQDTEKRVAAGELINIGTPEMPLYIPADSPAARSMK